MWNEGAAKGSRSDPRGSAPPLVQANVPSLPKGGGAIRAIGEKFSANAATGTGSLSVPIATTPGRSGFHPELALTYDSGAGNGPFGLGFRLAVPNITRKTDKRIPEYDDLDGSDVFLLSGAEDLVPELDEVGSRVVRTRGALRVERYRPRIEGLFARIERWEEIATGNVHWTSTTPANVRSVYGERPEARIFDPRDPKRVFTWLLERSEDALGNVIAYEYAREDLGNVEANPSEIHRLSGLAPVANTYLKRVRYGNSRPGDAGSCVFEVVFDYGEHDTLSPAPEVPSDTSWLVRRDPFSSYRAGFEIRTYRLCRRALVFHRFAELGDEPCLVRSTNFTYAEDASLTRLVAVEQEGFERSAAGGPYTSLKVPPLTFEYGRAAIQTAIHELDSATLDALSAGVDGTQHHWVDLDGEGIPGVLTEDGGALYYRTNLGGGTLGPPRRLPTQPSSPSRGTHQLLDLDGDGKLAMVSFQPPWPGFSERIVPGEAEFRDGGWEPFRPFASLPNIDWNDPNLRFIDLNGDGLDDVLVASDDVFVWYPSLAKAGFGPPRTFPRPRDEETGPAVVFADKAGTVMLADLGGDGLRDLVRVTNGSICYWPNLGHGRFGAKVTMARAPVFDHPDLFDPKRILFADIDGSGTTDMLYVGREGVRFWFNQAGNAWGPAQELPGLPLADSSVSVTAVDILGSGTACLVWSSPLPGEPTRIRYVDVLGSKKPHLLETIDNHLGLETRLDYAPSTKFYLADRAAGRPWTTRLPFPVHVLTRIETYDAVRRVRFVSEYAYRDGYFDGHEREFRGFGYVEQRDTESDPAASGKGHFGGRPPPLNGELPQPPVITQTWFHTGAWFSEATSPARPNVLPAGLTPEESREAYRALKGALLLQKVFARDGSARQDEPFTVVEKSYEVRCLQRGRKDVHGVFYPVPRESVERHCERDPLDPRVVHELILDVDAWGHVRRSVSVAYARRDVAGRRDEQNRLFATATEIEVVNAAEHDDWFRHGVPLETRAYELGGLTVGNLAGRPEGLFTYDEVRSAAVAAEALAYHDALAGDRAQKRLIERVRTRYYDGARLPEPLPFGEIDALALVYETYALAFTPELVDRLYGGRVDAAILAEGGYVVLEDPDEQWVPSGRSLPGRTAGAGFEIAPFYLPTEFVDPFGNKATLTYDAKYALVVEASVDAKGNRVAIETDFRTMSPRLVTDANGNRTAVELDALGRVVATRVMGREGTSEGDPTPGLPTTTVRYTFFAGPDRPSSVRVSARETHGDPATRWHHTLTYSDGSGHEVMKKVQAEPGLAPRRGPDGELLHGEDGQLVWEHVEERWVGTGRTVFDNKGNPIKQYEPFFSDTSAYETDEELAEWGVTPILHYDALGRLLRTEFPDGSLARVTFSPWEEERWDQNDTVLDPENAWFAEHAPAADSVLVRDHARTPNRTLVDALGRPFLEIADNGPGGRDETRTFLDIEGNPLAVRDARGNDAMKRAFSMLGQACRQRSIDAGERWTLVDVLGHPLRVWDAQGAEIGSDYDELRRPTRLWVRRAGGAKLVLERTTYGEDAGAAQEQNLRGRIHRHYDGAGLVTNARYDFKGNLEESTRQLAVEYASELDWSASPEPALEAEEWTHTTSFDALGRPTLLTTPHGSEVRHAFNEAGLLERVEARVRPTDEWTVHVGNIDYDAKGQRERIVYGPGNGTGDAHAAVTECAYDELTFRLTRLVTRRRSDGERIQALSYAYDPVGNILAIEDGAQKDVYFGGTLVEATSTFEYDPLYRLTAAEGREQKGGLSDAQRDQEEQPIRNVPHRNDLQAVRRYRETYDYDRVGNIERMVHKALGGDSQGSWTRHYRYLDGANRLDATSADGDGPGEFSARYGHDDHGNMTSMPHLRRIDWDAKDQKRRVDREGGGVVHFTYDAAGERVRKVWEHDGLVEERIYLGGWEIYRRREGAAKSVTLERETLHVMDDKRRIALVETKTVDAKSPASVGQARVRHQLGNHLGSVALEVDESGQIISYEEYHPYGTSAYRASASGVEVSAKRYRYTGKERDEETGLYYHGARYYAPWLGRWTSADPAGMGDGPNLYPYVGGNPINSIDPSGRRGLNPNDPNVQRLRRQGASDADIKRLISSDPRARKKASGSAATGGAGHPPGPRTDPGPDRQPAPNTSPSKEQQGRPGEVELSKGRGEHHGAGGTGGGTTATNAGKGNGPGNTWLDALAFIQGMLGLTPPSDAGVSGAIPGGAGDKAHASAAGQAAWLAVQLFWGKVAGAAKKLGSAAKSAARGVLTKAEGAFGKKAAEEVGEKVIESVVPRLPVGSQGEMLQAAVDIVQASPASEKVRLMTEFARQIESASSGAWSAKIVPLADGSTAFVGDAGRTMIITARGRIFSGVGSDAFKYTAKGIEPALEKMKEIPSLLGH